MYKVYCDGVLICDSRVEELAILNPKGRIEVNKAGTFSFVMPPNHPYYEAVKNRSSIIDVYRGTSTEPIFEGVCVEITDDFYKQRTIECEGELSFLNDSIQRPARYQNMNTRSLLSAYITSHNSQVENNKKFEIGSVTVDGGQNLFRYTNYESTMKEISDDLISDLGGYLRIRHSNNKRYIDYLNESPNTCSQVIKLGKNLLSLSKNLSSEDIATAIIPLGATLDEESRTTGAVEGLDERVTIKSVNDGLDYLISTEAVNEFGMISKVITWDNITTPAALKTKGQKYLQETQFETLVIEAKALDLHIANEDVEEFKVLDLIRVVSTPHGLNKYFMLSKLEFNLNNPENDVITLGIETKATMTAKSQSANSEILKKIEEVQPSTIINEATANATALITQAMGGYVYKTNSELYIMDTNNPDTATKVWRWNVNGLGYSKNGINGPYGLAMTMDGKIVADFITTGTMLADRIYGGTLELGRVSNEAGTIVVYSNSGSVIMRINKNGLYLNGNYFEVHTDNFECDDDGVSIKGDVEADSLLYHNNICMVYGDDYVESDKCQVIGLEYSDGGAGSSYYNLVIGKNSLTPIGTGRKLTNVTEIKGNLKVDGYIETNGYTSLGGGWYKKRLSATQYEYIFRDNIGSGSYSAYGNMYVRTYSLSFPESISNLIEFNANIFGTYGLFTVSMNDWSSSGAKLYIGSAKSETVAISLNYRMIVTK